MKLRTIVGISILLILASAGGAYGYAVSSNDIEQCDDKGKCTVSLEFSESLTMPADTVTVHDPHRNYDHELAFSKGVAIYSLSAGTKSKIYDCDIRDAIDCSCPFNWEGPALDAHCEDTDAYRAGNPVFEMTVAENGWNDCFITRMSAVCCYSIFPKSTDIYTVYGDLTARLEGLSVEYKRKTYFLPLNSKVDMGDMDTTLLTVNSPDLPLANYVAVVDATGAIKTVQKSFVNGPNEYDPSKAGWWRQDVSSMEQKFSQFPTNVRPKTNIFQSNLNVAKLKDFPAATNLILSPLTQGDSVGRKITRALIFAVDPEEPFASVTPDSGVSSTHTSVTGANYIPFPTATPTMVMAMVNGKPEQVCMIGNVICICQPPAPTPQTGPTTPPGPTGPTGPDAPFQVPLLGRTNGERRATLLTPERDRKRFVQTAQGEGIVGLHTPWYLALADGETQNDNDNVPQNDWSQDAGDDYAPVLPPTQPPPNVPLVVPITPTQTFQQTLTVQSCTTKSGTITVLEGNGGAPDADDEVLDDYSTKTVAALLDGKGGLSIDATGTVTGFMTLVVPNTVQVSLVSQVLVPYIDLGGCTPTVNSVQANQLKVILVIVGSKDNCKCLLEGNDGSSIQIVINMVGASFSPSGRPTSGSIVCGQQKTTWTAQNAQDITEVTGIEQPQPPAQVVLSWYQEAWKWVSDRYFNTHVVLILTVNQMMIVLMISQKKINMYVAAALSVLSTAFIHYTTLGLIILYLVLAREQIINQINVYRSGERNLKDDIKQGYQRTADRVRTSLNFGNGQGKVGYDGKNVELKNLEELRNDYYNMDLSNRQFRVQKVESENGDEQPQQSGGEEKQMFKARKRRN